MTAGVCHTGSMARYSATNRRQLLRFRSNGQLHLLEAAGGLRIVAHHVDRLMRAAWGARLAFCGAARTPGPASGGPPTKAGVGPDAGQSPLTIFSQALDLRH